MEFNSRQILRNYVHDIIATLKDGEDMTLVELCYQLSLKFKINIHPLYLKEILNKWDDKKYTGVFSPYDNRWLRYDKKKSIVGSSIQQRDPRLGKSRSKMLEEEKEKALKNKKSNKKEFDNVVSTGDKYQMAPVYALTSKVINATFIDVTDDHMVKITNSVLTNPSIEKSYSGYWNAMTEYGEKMGLKYKSDYMKYSPENFVKELN